MKEKRNQERKIGSKGRKWMQICFTSKNVTILDTKKQ